MSTTMTMKDTPIDAIEGIFKELRQSFNNGKTKSIAWRKNQLEQLYKMCDEQRDILASANNADFHRPHFETLLFDCGSVSTHYLLKYSIIMIRIYLDSK